MKRNYFILTVGGLIAVVVLSLLFTFQVRQTEVALVTRFGKPVRSYNAEVDNQAGLKFKFPWPVENVQKFDKRIQNFEGKFQETPTGDAYNVLVMTYAGWRVVNPTVFRERFGGGENSFKLAHNELERVISSAKNGVIGRHPFSDLISTDTAQLKFDDVEKEILAAVAQQAKANYGIEVKFLGIKRLGLPEAITQKVFDRMTQERQRFVLKLQGEGEAKAADLRSAANRERDGILTQARTEVVKLQGEAEAEAAKSYAAFKENPELAVFLLKIRALEDSLKQNATLILDQNTIPFDMLDGRAGKAVK